MSLKRWKTIVDMVLASVSVLALLCAGGFAVYKYLQREHEARVEKTLTFMERYNGPELSSARSVVEQAWEKESETITRVLTQQTKPEETARNYYDLVIFIVESNDLGPKIVSRMQFFEELVVCIENNICDEATSDAFFANEAQSFFRQVYPYVCDLRSRWGPSIGAKLENYFNPGSAGQVCLTK